MADGSQPQEQSTSSSIRERLMQASAKAAVSKTAEQLSREMKEAHDLMEPVRAAAEAMKPTVDLANAIKNSPAVQAIKSIHDWQNNFVQIGSHLRSMHEELKYPPPVPYIKPVNPIEEMRRLDEKQEHQDRRHAERVEEFMRWVASNRSRIAGTFEARDFSKTANCTEFEAEGIACRAVRQDLLTFEGLEWVTCQADARSEACQRTSVRLRRKRGDCVVKLTDDGRAYVKKFQWEDRAQRVKLLWLLKWARQHQKTAWAIAAVVGYAIVDQIVESGFSLIRSMFNSSAPPPM